MWHGEFQLAIRVSQTGVVQMKPTVEKYAEGGKLFLPRARHRPPSALRVLMLGNRGGNERCHIGSNAAGKLLAAKESLAGD